MRKEPLQQAVIEFVEKLCTRHSLEAGRIEAETDLFTSGILDSMRFVELMKYIEADLGIDVPDKMLVTNFFQTPAIIAKNFATEGSA